MAFSRYPSHDPIFLEKGLLSAPAGIDPNVEIVRLALKILWNKQRALSLKDIHGELCNQSFSGSIDSQFISALDTSQLWGILTANPNHFTLISASTIRPKTKIELCKSHCSMKGNCPGRPNVPCNGLHLCKFYILDSCNIRICKFGHDIASKHNIQIRQEYLLDLLDIKELQYLLTLMENRSELTVPKICRFYNNARGCQTQQGKSCSMLHICRHFIMDDCRHKQHCKWNHDIFATDVTKILIHYKIDISRSPKEIIADLQEALSKDEDKKAETTGSEALDQRCATTPCMDLKRSTSTPNLAMQKLSLYPQRVLSVDNSEESLAVDSAGFTCGARKKSSTSINHQFSPKEKSTPDRQLSTESTQGTQICLYNLRGQCWFKDSCRHVHKNMPYQWQIRYQSNVVWEDFGEQDNLDVEFNFCDPQCDDCFCEDRSGLSLHIFFERMEAEMVDTKSLEVRRLSTISLEDAENQPLATRWRWFWQDQSGKWKEYGSKNMTGYETNIDSEKLEQRYLANPKGQFPFASTGHEYTMDFSMMTQQNMATTRTRRVKRRPEHVSSQEVKIRKQQPVRSGVSQRVPGAGIGMNPCVVPSTWNVQQDVIDHFNKVEVKFNREEYQKVESLFMESMPSRTSIISIKRIENGELWSNYFIKKEKMKRKNLDLKELNLFHGTRSKYIDAISHQGFDFRLSGQSTGNIYGKGSYFAKTARFADSYAEHGQYSTLFLVRVLAGDYTKGDGTYSRPPLKDPRNPCSDLYDSCVDDLQNPKLFVIFENCQMYPEYVINYKLPTDELDVHSFLHV